MAQKSTLGLHALIDRLRSVVAKTAAVFLTKLFSEVDSVQFFSEVDSVQYFSAVDSVQYFSEVDSVQYFSEVATE